MSANSTLNYPSETGATSEMLAAAPHRIGAVTLVVHDLEQAVDFYTEVMGLVVLARSADNARLGVDGIALITLRRDTAARRSSPREAGLFHTAFLLPSRADLSAWLRHASKLQVSLQGASDHLVSEALYLADPENNGIEIYVDRPARTWSRVASGVAMATERLDLSALAATSDHHWSGFPTGGQIGHVHLQVGQLDPAEAFYRDVLGFDVMSRFPGATFFGSGGYHHQLAANIWRSRGAGSRSGKKTGLAEIEIVTVAAQIESTRTRATPGTIRTDGPGRLTLVDPWGTLFTLVNLV